jgi:hypothetical protein
MRVNCELWDTEESNLIGTFGSEREALRVVREAVVAHGLQAIATIALGCEDAAGNLIPVAKGQELVDLATSRGESRLRRTIGKLQPTRTATH